PSRTKIAIVGLGYVGLPLALLVARNGYDVTGIDLDKRKVRLINNRQDPIGDEYIAAHLRSSGLIAVADFSPVESADIVIICVPTPVKSGIQPDLGPLKNATASVASKLKTGSLVIIESTINPGVCDEVVIPAIEKKAGLEINKHFYAAHCPERINPGDKKWTVENIPRVVGASNKKGLQLALEFYKTIIRAPIKPMATLKEAEAVKIVENSFRDVNIAFVNELALSFSKLGINVKNVIDGAATKPFAFMPHYPSVGVGGHCIPVDPYYLIEYARGYGFEHEFLSLARTINDRMPQFTVEQLIEGLGEVGMSLRGATVLVLGLAYKPDVADDRESPAYKVIKILRSKGARVKSYDPHLPDKSTAKSLPEAISGVSGVILVTNHKEFTNFPKMKHSYKVFVDGKNSFPSDVFTKQKVVYKGIGI
ncbi:hypothetical protein A3F38_01895, partial [Candidatus Saccharibacteria bacterium RIFCSPHIGHO2_12_FULL_48_21]